MTKLISFLEATTPIVQGCDFLLMCVAGIYCLRSARRRKNTGIIILAASCFVAAIILLGFFLSAAPAGKPLLPLAEPARAIAYAVARVLAPFELLLFALGIILVARSNR